MESPELAVILINLVIVLVAYLLVYPRFAGSNGAKISQNDVVASAVSLLVVGSVYWGSGQEFNTLVMTLNWFWFTVLTFIVIEIPVAIWYYRKHDVFD